MSRRKKSALRKWLGCAAISAMVIASDATGAQAGQPTHEGKGVAIGKGEAYTIVRTDDRGRVTSIGLIMTPGALEDLPETGPPGAHDVAYVLPMPADGPRTVIDHAVINWEPHGHPPPGVYDVPHFDYHFYVVSEDEQQRVSLEQPGLRKTEATARR